jgi:amidase
VNDPAFRSATVLAAAIRDRQIGSRELLDYYLARIERLNPCINAVVTLDVERARRRADAADAALRRSVVLGPLHGVPMTVKDCMEVAGLRTTAGAEVHAGHVPAHDAPAVQRLTEAGAVIFGKTNTPSLAMDAQTYNPIFGTTNNPWNAARSPGGSSGGAAAAVAAGLTALELGSDIGGSIRSPAHCCGVYGLKPTYGLIPTRGHIPPAPGARTEVDINVLGPLARSAADLDLALDVLAGPDADRGVAWRLQLPPARHRSLREYRVAAWLDDSQYPVDGAVRERLEAAVEALRNRGIAVDGRARPGFSLADAHQDFQRLLFPVTGWNFAPEAFEAMASYAQQVADDKTNPMSAMVASITLRHRQWLDANERREEYRAKWRAFFRNYDVLLCPINPVAAIRHDHNPDFTERTITVNGAARPYDDQMVWAGLVGMAYLPATVAPVGRTRDGLPVGVQIVGPYLEDRTPIDFARRLADVVGGFEAPPGFE